MDFFGRNFLGWFFLGGILLKLFEYGRNWFVCQDFGFCQDFVPKERKGGRKEGKFKSLELGLQVNRLMNTLHQNTFYFLGTLCIVNFCSKEQFASNWLVTVCSLTHFTPQHTLPPGMFFSSAQFASQHPLLLKTPCSSTHFASQHTLLLRTLCSSAHFASKNTLLLGTLYSSTHFAS